MNHNCRLRFAFTRTKLFFAVNFLVMCSASPVVAQLEITEIMFDPNDESVWEWIEVRNTSGSAIDLNGYYADRLSDPDISSSASPNIQNTVATNTIIPADGVAVLYDGFLGAANPATHNDQFFRDAWSLPGSVPLVSLNSFPTLTNTGTAVGFWPDRANYDADLIDPNLGGALCANPGAAGNTCEVGSFNNAAFSIDYSMGFPAGDGMSSVRWNGTGSNQDGANWQLSQDGVAGAVTSMQLLTPGADVGNPGIVPGGTAPAGVVFTEIMSNTSLNEGMWEWVEIYNNRGTPIDFNSTPFVFDDDDNADLSGANITSGSLANGTAAVLFDGDALTLQQIQDAWDPGGTNGTNFIPVSNFSGLANGGDTIALWDSFSAYLADTNIGGRTTANAIATVTYSSGSGWPTSTDGASINLNDLSADPTNSASWDLSSDGDTAGSFFISTDTPLHPGGDVGSPGSFNGVAPPNADFDGDGDVDGTDFLIWQRNFGVVGGPLFGLGDADGDGDVTAGDLAIWETQYGTSTQNADFDGDSDVDGTDYLIWQRNLGVVGGLAFGPGDANGDGDVTAGDLAIWEAQYGIAPLTEATTSVPEPTAVVLAVFVSCLVSLVSRQRRD